MRWPFAWVIPFLLLTWTEVKDFLQAWGPLAALIGGGWLAIKKAILPIERQVIQPPTPPQDPDATHPRPAQPAQIPLWQKFEAIHSAIHDLSESVSVRFDTVDGKLLEQDRRFNRADIDRSKLYKALTNTNNELEKLQEYVVQLERVYQRERRGDKRAGPGGTGGPKGDA